MSGTNIQHSQSFLPIIFMFILYGCRVQNTNKVGPLKPIIILGDNHSPSRNPTSYHLVLVSPPEYTLTYSDSCKCLLKVRPIRVSPSY